MADQFQGKRIPWSQYTEFKNLHAAAVQTYVSQHEIQLIDRAEFESKLPRPFFKIHSLLTQILIDNNILTSQQEHSASQLQQVVQTVMKFQNTVISQNLKNQQDIKGAIEQMKPEIAEQLGSQIHEEIQRGFLENVSGITDLIEEKFSQLELTNQQQHESVINAITNEKTNIIIQLQTEMKAKDAQIIELTSSENELKDKLQVKEETIEALNRTIEKIQQQLDYESSLKDNRLLQLESIVQEKEAAIEVLTKQNQQALADHEKSLSQIEELQRIAADMTALNKNLENQVNALKQQPQDFQKQCENKLLQLNIQSQLNEPPASEIQSAMIDSFLMKSKCISNKDEKKFLLKLLGNKRLETFLLYSGSIHGWYVKDFRSKCVDKNRTITLMKVKDGDCIGGYASAQIASSYNASAKVGDNDAMLFNLSCQRHFLNQGTSTQIHIHPGWGPFFSSETQDSELSLSYEPFNGDEKCHSHANERGYQIPVNDVGKNMLTNQKDASFTISELEVWHVKYLD